MTKTKRISGMVLGILFIGLCVSFLRLSQFGVDPFSAMNLGISGFIGWSFGTWQLLVNAIILVVVFFQARSCIGLGTIINMVFVGYIADFICYVANDVVQIQMNLPLRILALLLAQLMASMGVALYMVADMGIAPYDSVAIIIEKLTHQKIPFHKARILSDVVVVIIGIILAIFVQGNDLVTVLTALNKGFTQETSIEIVDKMLMRGGIGSMLSSVAIVIAAATFGAPLKTSGVIDFAVEKIMKVATSQKKVLLCSYLFHMLLIVIIGGYYTTFSIAGPMLQPLYEKYGLDKVNLSRCLEDTGTTFSPLIPWCSNGVYFTTTLGVAYADYALTTPLCWLCLVFAMIYILTNFKIKQAPKEGCAAEA